MVLIFIDFLKSLGIKVFSLFTYSSTRMIFAGLFSLILSILLGPFFIKKLYFLNIKEKIRKEKNSVLLFQLHKKKKNTPTMGGILIIFSVLISCFLWMDLKNIFFIILMVSTFYFGILGFFDDFLKLKRKKGISVKIKFFYQVIFSLLLALFLIFADYIFKKNTKFLPVIKEKVLKKRGEKINGKVLEKKKNIMKTLSFKEYMSRIYIPFCKKPFLINKKFLFCLILFIILVITGSCNSVNLADGLDGLACGLVILVASVLAVFAFFSGNIEMAKFLNILYIEKSCEIGVFLFAVIGASLGFLWHNGYPAQVFMGDIGSLFLGALLGISAVLLRRELILAISGGIFVVEAFSVILQVFSYKFRGKKRIFLCTPLHHHFEYMGWEENKIVIRFWILGLLLAVLSIATLKIQ